MLIHDLVKLKRLHRATLIGSAILIASVLVIPVFQKSEWGRAFVWSLA